MSIVDIARFLLNGQIQNAIQDCTSGFAGVKMSEMERLRFTKGEDFAAEKSRELLWIAAAHAKEEQWELCLNYARASWRIFPSPQGSQFDLYTKLLIVAGQPSNPDCETCRLVVETKVIPDIESEMATIVRIASKIR
jgi:hypothetical protein